MKTQKLNLLKKLIYVVEYISQKEYLEKIRNDKYKKAIADFSNRLPILEIFKADTHSEFIQELIQQMNFHLLNSSVKLLGYDFNKAINAD